MDNSEKAIVRTLLYSDIFDYPLSDDEVWKFLISNKNIDKKLFENKIKKINSIVFRKDGFLHMEDKSSVVSKRIISFRESKIKINLAYKTIEKLFIIPTVVFIGISGNLSMMNAGRKDDIDLFVITTKNTVWITRLLLIVYLKILGKHRKRSDKDVADKFCLNMIIDEDKLLLSKNLRSLYTAHEIVQLMPIMQRGDIYKKFIDSNKWVKSYMPNIIEEISGQKIAIPRKSILENFLRVVIKFPFFESAARILQVNVMKRNITREIIEDKFIALHPKDYKNIILARYEEKISRYGL